MFSWAGSEEKAGDDLFDRFTVDTGKKYGEGGYGATYAAYDTDKKEELAVKIIDSRRMRQDAIMKECSILESMDHPNVISIKAHSLGPKKKGHSHLYFIFMEAAPPPACPACHVCLPALLYLVPARQPPLLCIKVAGGGELFDQVIDRGSNGDPQPSPCTTPHTHTLTSSAAAHQ